MLFIFINILMSTVEQPKKLFDKLVTGSYILGASETHIFPINIVSKIEFTIIQNVIRPDHTPRFWLSKKQRSIAESWGGPVNFINIKNSLYSISIVASNNKKLYSNLYTFLVDPGLWYINIQNLENFQNGYAITLADS